MHEIYKVFDENLSLDVKWGFLDLTKAFARTWYNGLMCKLKCLGIYGNEYGLYIYSQVIGTKGWFSIVNPLTGHLLRL